jgi:hypothetical protein
MLGVCWKNDEVAKHDGKSMTSEKMVGEFLIRRWLRKTGFPPESSQQPWCSIVMQISDICQMDITLYI